MNFNPLSLVRLALSDGILCAISLHPSCLREKVDISAEHALRSC
jgi:hypothetical protein